jgi:hypothetical protein
MTYVCPARRARRPLGRVPFGCVFLNHEHRVAVGLRAWPGLDHSERSVSTCLRREKCCHNGGMAFAPSSRPDATAGSWGSMIGAHGPHRGPLEVAGLQEKWAMGERPCLWVRRWARLPLFSSQRQEVLPQRGMTPRHGSASTRQGSTIGMVASIVDPGSCPVCSGKAVGSGVRALWGPQWTRLPPACLTRRKCFLNGGMASASQICRRAERAPFLPSA